MGRRGRGGADAVSVAWNPQKAAAWSVLCPRLCAVALPEVQVWVSESAPSPPRAAGAPGWSGRSAEGCPRSCGEGGSAAAPGGCLDAAAAKSRSLNPPSLSSLAVLHQSPSPDLGSRHGTGKTVRPRAALGFTNFVNCSGVLEFVGKPEEFRSKLNLSSGISYTFCFPFVPLPRERPPEPAPTWRCSAAAGDVAGFGGRSLFVSECVKGSLPKNPESG